MLSWRACTELSCPRSEFARRRFLSFHLGGARLELLLATMRRERPREQPLLRDSEPTAALLATLIARYNLAKLVDVTAAYLIEGRPAEPIVVLRRHKANVDSMLELDPDPELEHAADLVAVGAESLIASSIWSYARRGLGARVDAFIERLVAADEP